jgi:hypothetical protein
VRGATRSTPQHSRRGGRRDGGRGGGRALALALAGYLALSVVLWWHVWSSHPSSVTMCGCDDPSLFVWFLEWPAYALAHGHNPFFSTALFHPTGINLLSNTGVLALGIPLAPVTWLFGPVVTLNVASTLGPALTALAMFWLLRRWVQWTPAAFVGGLVFGFAPFAVANVAVAHLNTEILALVPLVVACLDEVLVRQRRRPLVAGGALGLLVVVQFFLSTEILAIVALCAACGIVILVAYGLLRDRGAVIARLPHALYALAAAMVVAVVLLAYPVWFSLKGPAHLSGLVWPTLVPGTGGIVLSDIWHLRFMNQPAVHLFAGYEGPALPQGEYLGVGLLVVVVLGLLVWWRDVRLWFFGAVRLVTVALSLDITSHYWVPWRVLAHIPLIQNVTVARFFGMTTVCAAVLLGLVVDRTYSTMAGGLHRQSTAADTGPATATSAPTGRRTVGAALAGMVALGVAAVAVVPMGSAIATNVPLTVQSVAVPRWFTEVGPSLPSNQVVLTYPPPVTGGSAMTWQAVDLLRYALATGAGPESIPARAGRQRAGLDVITSDSEVFSTPAPATVANVAAVRRALAGWGVTYVVVPDPSGLVPRYNRTSSTAAALGLFTLALGRPPVFSHDAWVWRSVERPDPALSLSTDSYRQCTAEALTRLGSPEVVPDCVMASAREVTTPAS